jgi:hypothetical protein
MSGLYPARRLRGFRATGASGLPPAPAWEGDLPKPAPFYDFSPEAAA